MDTPPLRHFILVISLLSLFVILVTTMPSELYAGAPSYRETEIPSYFEALDLSQYASTYVINITSNVVLHEWGKSEFGHDMRLDAYIGDHELANWHGYRFLGVWTGGHEQHWYNKDGLDRGKWLSSTEIDLDFFNGSASYSVKCSHFQMQAWIGYNDSAYSSSEEAWDAYALSVLFAIEFDEIGTGMDAWNLIGMMLFFQLPEIHPVLNVIIATPIWACIAWLAFAFIIAVIKALPFT